MGFIQECLKLLMMMMVISALNCPFYSKYESLFPLGTYICIFKILSAKFTELSQFLPFLTAYCMYVGSHMGLIFS